MFQPAPPRAPRPGAPAPPPAPPPLYAQYPYAPSLMREPHTLLPPAYLEAHNAGRDVQILSKEAPLFTREAQNQRQAQIIRESATFSKEPSNFLRNTSNNPSNFMVDPHNYASELYNTRPGPNVPTEAQNMTIDGTKFMRNCYSKEDPNMKATFNLITEAHLNNEAQNLMKRAPNMKEDQYFNAKEQSFTKYCSNLSGEAQKMRIPTSQNTSDNSKCLTDLIYKSDHFDNTPFNSRSINGFCNDLLGSSPRTQNSEDFLLKKTHLNIPQVPKMYDFNENKSDSFGSKKNENFQEPNIVSPHSYKYFDVKPDFSIVSQNVVAETQNSPNVIQQTRAESPNLDDNIQATQVKSPNMHHTNESSTSESEKSIDSVKSRAGKSTEHINNTNSDHNFNSKPSQIGDANLIEVCLTVKRELAEELAPSCDKEENSNDSTSDSEPLSGGVGQNWTDVDFMKPFTRDTNGFSINDFDVTRYTLVDKNDSWDTAVKEIIAVPSDDFNRSKLYQCRYCELTFRHPKRYLIHYKWHTYGQINDKRRQHEEAKLLRRLARRKVPEKNYGDVGGAFKCDSCDMAFSNKQKYHTHKSKAHATLPKECPLCLKMFPNAAEMRSHQKADHTVQEEDKFMCDECPKTFKFLHSLVRHQATHMEKIFPCDKCDKKFGSELLVAIHSKTHERAEKGAAFHCSYCGKGFHQPYSLAVHERGHSGEKPFECHLCKSRYISNSSLMRHIKVSHQNESKPYKCIICHRSFLTEQIRERHALRVHSEPIMSPSHEGKSPQRAKRRRRRAKDDE